jgi:hypothetical protein
MILALNRLTDNDMGKYHAYDGFAGKLIIIFYIFNEKLNTK